jgi:hypothetical protein
MTPFTAALSAEMVVVIAILVGAAVLTNMGAIGNAIGWLQ